VEHASLTTAILARSPSRRGVFASHSASDTFFAGELDEAAREGKFGRLTPEGVAERDMVDGGAWMVLGRWKEISWTVNSDGMCHATTAHASPGGEKE
jgi:hypothetical protein